MFFPSNFGGGWKSKFLFFNYQLTKLPICQMPPTPPPVFTQFHPTSPNVTQKSAVGHNLKTEKPYLEAGFNSKCGTGTLTYADAFGSQKPALSCRRPAKISL